MKSIERHKYPRTSHLPWSPGSQRDDNRLDMVDHFEGIEVVVTEKMDGENTSIYSDGSTHERSIDSRHHPSRDRIKKLAAALGHHLPCDWRLCGEYLYARHSLAYDDLESYFYLFSVWNDENVALSWDETCEWADLLDLTVVPELYRGPFREELIREIEIDTENQEGFVVRFAERIPFEAFATSVAKWVRKGHVQTDEHWMFQPVIPNGLARGDA